MRRLVAVLVLTGIGAGGMWACGGDTLGVEDIPGIWEAISVNGSDVPGSVPTYVGGDTEIVEVVYDRFTFFDGNTCVYSFQQDGFADTLDGCEWERHEDPKRITIKPFAEFSDYSISGTVSGGRMTMSWPNEGGQPNVAVYQKQ